MKHQLSIGRFKATKTKTTAKVKMASWGGDNFFVVRVYKGTTYLGRMEFSKSRAGSPYTSSFSGLKKGTKYGYEIWKNQNGKYIKGSGTLSY